jgi:hypothetical protein
MRRREFTGPIGAGFVACAAHAQLPATPVPGFLDQRRRKFITLPCVLVTAWPFATSPFCEMSKAEIPNKPLGSYTGTRFVFSS